MSITNSPASTPIIPAFTPYTLHPTLLLGCLVHGGGPPCPPLLHPLVLCSRLPREFFYVHSPRGPPMTPALWGVRRMSFGYFCVVQTSALSSRASSCHWLNPRRIRRVNPRFFLCLLPRISFEFSPPLHSTPYTPSGCLVHGGGPPCFSLLHPLVLCSRLPREVFYVYYPRDPR